MKSEMRSGLNGYMGLGRRNIRLGSCRQEDQLGPSKRRNSGRVVELWLEKLETEKRKKEKAGIRYFGGLGGS